MKVLICGYYGFNNAGDEWILEALLRPLRASEQQITILSANPWGTQQRQGVAALNRWRFFRVFRALRDCEVFISGGGGLIQDLSGPWTPAYYLGVMAAARLLGKRVLLAGQGFGPLRRVWNHWLCRGVLPRAAQIIVRDPASQTWCQAHGVVPEKLALGADWVWSLPATPHPAGRDWAICLRADRLRNGTPAWLTDLLSLAKAQGRRVRFLVLGNGGDRECLQGILGETLLKEDIVDVTGMSWAQALERMRGIGWVLSMRYHGLILGAAAGAAVAGWGDDPKLGGLLQELRAPDLRSVVGAEALKSMLAQGAAARRTQLFQVSKLRRRAQDMTEQVREFLEIR